MCEEMKIIINRVIKNNIVFIISIFLLMITIGQAELAIIFSLGLLVATINFMVSGIIFEQTIRSNKKIIRCFFSLSYILRIIIIVVIACLFIYNIDKILAYILGFSSFFIILIISWIKNKKESE